MTLAAHGDRKYQTSESLVAAAEWPALRVELRRLNRAARHGFDDFFVTPEGKMD